VTSIFVTSEEKKITREMKKEILLKSLAEIDRRKK
jgi:hypothetical protein